MLAPEEIERFLELAQRLPELTADEVGRLTIVAKPGVLATAPGAEGALLMLYSQTPAAEKRRHAPRAARVR